VTVYVALQTNVPLVGKIRAAYWNHTDYAKEHGWDPNLQLYGDWEKFVDNKEVEHTGKGVLSVHLSLVEDLVKLGIMSVGPQEDGHDTFKVKDDAVQLLRKEKGKKKWVEVSLVNQGGTPTPAASPIADEAERVNPFRKYMVRQRDLMVSCYKVAFQTSDLVGNGRDGEQVKTHEAAMAFYIQANRDGMSP